MIIEWLKALSQLDALQKQRDRLALDDLAPPGPRVVRACEALAEVAVQTGVRPPDKVLPLDEGEVALRWVVDGGYVAADVTVDAVELLYSRGRMCEQEFVSLNSIRHAALTLRDWLAGEEGGDDRD